MASTIIPWSSTGTPATFAPWRLLATLGAKVAGVPVDDQGIVDAIPPGTRLVYVTPSHQFPLGGVDVAAAAHGPARLGRARTRRSIVEDDYDSEFRFGGRPIEPLQSLDRDGRVIYVGSFSKTLLPALRLGFLVAPPSLRPAVRAAKLLTDWHAPAPQGALASFIQQGLFARHLRKMRAVYRARHEQVVDALTREFAAHLKVIPSAVGLHLAATVPGDSSEDLDGLLRRASSAGVELLPLSLYGVDTPPLPGLDLRLWRHPHRPHRRRAGTAPPLSRRLSRDRSEVP